MVSRMDKDYQAMFHPFRDGNLGKGRSLAKAVGLWIGTLGIYPLVAGIKHYRAKQKTQGDLNPTDKKTDVLSRRYSNAMRKDDTPEGDKNVHFQPMASQTEGNEQPSVEEPKKVETEPQKESTLVDAQFAVEIGEMPGMPERAWIKVSGPCPPEKAFEVVRLIARSIGPEFEYMELKEEGSIATDAGGPRRQFFTRLFEDLITNPPGAKYFNTDESGLPIPILPEDPEAVAFFEDLGKVFGLCAKHNVIVGPLFHRVTFELMAKINEDPFFSNDIGSYDFGEAGTLERFYPLYEEIETRSKSGQEILRQVNLVKSKEEKSDDDKDLLADLPEFVKKRLLPLLAISKGLKTHYPVDSKTADNILGMPLNNEKIITQLQFKFLPKEKEEWVKNWVLKVSPEDLEKFLFTITGAKAISPKHSIIFRSDPESNNIETDTCYRTWTMNFDAFDTEEELHSVLSGVISYERGFELR